MVDSKIWNMLSFFEQLSNIDGEVSRLIDSHKRFENGDAKEDHSKEYLDKINYLIKITFEDPKNSSLARYAKELYDEADEINRYIEGEVDSDYISRYWHQYTNAVS